MFKVSERQIMTFRKLQYASTIIVVNLWKIIEIKHQNMKNSILSGNYALFME
jgi:hypothetical protein